MNDHTSLFADKPFYRKLAAVPSTPLLYGDTPITRLSTPIRSAATETLKMQLPRETTIVIKRDDLTPGFGNKTRKLETILADAQAKGADTIITAGGPQSNHCRQTAQFARQFGMDTHLMFGTSSGERDFPYVGNQVVDRLFGAMVYTCKKQERDSAMHELASELTAQGKNPYIIPVGGSNFLGVLGYAKGFIEFLQQTALQVDRIVVATSSGGTQAGLVLGAALAEWDGDILGISIDQIPDEDEPSPESGFVSHMCGIANEALDHLGLEMRLDASHFKLNYNYLQGGYGVVGDYDRIGVRTLANHGIIAGPVYSGRAFGALLDLLTTGSIPSDGTTLFWHTGGAGELDFYKNILFM